MALSHFYLCAPQCRFKRRCGCYGGDDGISAVALADSTNGSEEDSGFSFCQSLKSGVSVDETDANSAGVANQLCGPRQPACR